jgi:hypothetical protein
LYTNILLYKALEKLIVFMSSNEFIFKVTKS